MHFKTFYWNLLAPFAALYAFFLLRFLAIYFKQKKKYHLRLSFISLSSLVMASMSAIMLAQEERINLHLFTLAAFANYTGYYIYFKLISNRFNYKDALNRALSLALGLISVCILLAMMAGLFGDHTWIYNKGTVRPDNIFLATTVGSYRLSPIAHIISIGGTFSVWAANFYLLWRFLRQRLVGYQKLVLWGVVTSLFVKLNDFTLTTGMGTYLIPLGFINYFFEIIYFHFQDNQENSED